VRGEFLNFPCHQERIPFNYSKTLTFNPNQRRFVMKRFAPLLTLILLVFLTSLSLAEIPKMINYQGMLTGESGNALTDTLDLQFRIYNAQTSGTLKWSETQSQVPIIDGLFNVILGSVNPIDTLSFSENYWLEVQVGSDTMPRLRFTSVGYAYRALKADTADYALSAPGGPSGNNWIFRITDTADTTITTGGPWGIAQFGNTLYGSNDSTHVNFGVASTTGASGQNWKYCTIGGGLGNTASGSEATVGGGTSNTASGVKATVGGGYSNSASGYVATIGGGQNNTANTHHTTVAGGLHNIASGYASTVAGGDSNTASSNYATVGGGVHNVASGYKSIVGGGESDTSKGAFGGVFSGRYNLAGDASTDTGAFVGGGRKNSATNMDATVCGGSSNKASGGSSTVGGGYNNNASGSTSTVGGGSADTASGGSSTIGGGYSNLASGINTTVGGGHNNEASGFSATISGGHENFNAGSYSAIPGGYRDTITTNADYSTAFGRNVYVDDSYYVVLFDSLYSGHLQLNRDHRGIAPTGYPIRVGTNTTNGNAAYLTGGGVWTDISSRSKKENFQELDGTQVLNKIENMSVTQWHFKGTEEQHISPVAEDFYQAFGCGTGIPEDDSTSVASIDLAGVSLAAIQELSRIIKEQQREIELLKAKIEALETRGK
jgi:hypothetical protein